jgi:hypothetical protein
MNTKNKADNQSPWPACADCQSSTEEHGTTSEAACTARAEHDVAGEARFDGLEPAAELGPRRDSDNKQPKRHSHERWRDPWQVRK